ncbi:MAG: hypothetical protein CMJ27_14095 [Phycisphaerae bacterium]|nr:hypothetical protein [Phycisphaerae bacterium]
MIAHVNSDTLDAEIEHDRAPVPVMIPVMKDDTGLRKQCMDSHGFKRWMTDSVLGPVLRLKRADS